jgi:hypothetical protein
MDDNFYFKNLKYDANIDSSRKCTAIKKLSDDLNKKLQEIQKLENDYTYLIKVHYELRKSFENLKK